MEVYKTSSPPITMVPSLHQSNGYIKMKLRVWRAQKCITLVGVETVLTSAGPQTTPFHGWQYRAENEKMAKLRAYQSPWYCVCTKAMLISKGNYRYGELENVVPWSVRKPYLVVRARKLPRILDGSLWPRMEICKSLGPPTPMVPHLHQSNGYIKRKLRVWRAQKCIPLVGTETVLTCAEPQTTPFHGWKCRAVNGNMRKFGPTNPHGSAFAPKQWLYLTL